MIEYQNNDILNCNIDAVYTYVNFRDDKWLNKYKKYKNINVNNEKLKKNHRYYSLNELELSVKHTLKYCPFIRNIFIVTDNQIPYWYSKELYSNVFIIFHKDIFQDGCVYPTYNSNTIESMIDNIPNLSEIFIYLNDDNMINLNKQDLFEDKNPISLFLKRNWNYDLETAKKKHKNNPAVFALYKTIKLAEKYFKKSFNISYTHQAYFLSKTAFKKTKELFNEQYKKKIKLRFRQRLSNDDLVFPLLVSIVSTELNISKLKIIDDTKLTRIFLNYSLNKTNKLNTILKKNYNFICINDIKHNLQLLEHYYKFSQKLRMSLSNIENAHYISLKDILVINLKRNKDRLTNFNNNLHNNDFNINVIEAFDGYLICNKEYHDIKNDKNKFQGYQLTRKGEYGCWNSHIKCYKYIVDNAIEWCVIMEDDAILKPNLSNKFKNLLIPSDADIIYIHKGCTRFKNKPTNIPNYNIFIDGWGTHGYIISYRCAKKILDSIYSKIYYLPMDSLLNKLGKHFRNRYKSKNRDNIKHIKLPKSLNLNIYVVKNEILGYSKFKSTI